MPALQITINAQCVPVPNGDNAHLSKTSAGTESNQVNWKAANACTVTVPAGYFSASETVITLSAGVQSGTYTLLSTAPTGEMDYTITGCTSTPPDPPMIVIDN